MRDAIASILRYKGHTGTIPAKPMGARPNCSDSPLRASTGLAPLAGIKEPAYFPTPVRAGIIDTLNARPSPYGPFINYRRIIAIGTAAIRLNTQIFGRV